MFWMDPANDLTSVMLVQHVPFNGDIHYRFRNAVYNVVERGETATE